MSEELKSVAAATNEAEAELIRGRLLEAGIPTIVQRSLGGPEWGGSGARNIFVKDDDLERAQALLAYEEGAFSDEELSRLSEEAGRAGEGE